MSDNPCYKSCVNRSPARSPTRDQQQCAPIVPPPCGDVGAPAFKIEEQLNEVYEKRLAEINEETNGDPELKEITYKEWITMLRQINKTLITNIQDMDRETTERLSLLQRRASANCRFGQGSDLCKCRKDMASLMQLVRQARRTGDWSVDKFNFETITEQDIFGNDASSCEQSMKYETDCSKQSSSTDPRSCASQKSKLIANVKALAFEVADKHDEIRDLKKQILSMEDEIQKAQKKIQLKDDVIRELRSDLKALPKCSHWGARIPVPSSCSMQMSDSKSFDSCQLPTPRNSPCYSNRDSINSLSCNPMDCAFGLNISEDDYEEEEFIKCLKEELNQLFEMRRSHDQDVEEQRRAIGEQQNRLGDMVDKLLKSNNDFQNKLRYYRRELLVLEKPQSSRTLTYCSDGDSGISSDSDPDVKIVNSVRNRISGLVDENNRLKKEEQCLEINFQDVNCKAIAKSELLDKTSNALKEVADALTNATCKPIAYEKIFEKCQNMTNNPIVDAVDNLVDMLKERENMIGELRRQITNTGKINQELEGNTEKLRAELCELKQSMSSLNQVDNRSMLFQNQEFSKRLLKKAEKYQEDNSGTHEGNQSEYLKIIDDLSTELNTLSRQVNMVQREFPTDEVAKQFETSLQGLETQNDLLQSAVENLMEEKDTIEQTLKTQNEDLKGTLCEREQQICVLQNQIAQLEQRPCERCVARTQSECAQRDDRRRTPRDDRRGTPRNESPEELQKLEYELRGKSRLVECLQQENTKLLQELADIRRNQAKMKLLERQRGGSSAGRAGSGDHDAAKFSAIQDKSREQCKALQKAARDIAGLQQEINDLRANEESFSKERDLLQTELIALKENQASQLGTKQSLQEQLQGTINELYVAKEKLHECMQSKDRLQCMHRDEVKRFQELKAEMFEKYNNLVEDYNDVLKEYQKVIQIEQEKTNQIRAFNAWKDEQIQIEREVRRKMELFENHIKQMLEDKQNLMDRLNETENDNRTLLQAIDQLKTSSMSNQSAAATSCPSRGYTVIAANSSTDPVSKVIENVRNTTRRLSQQRCILEDEASRFLSK